MAEHANNLTRRGDEHAVVSSEDEEIILVDSNDNELGFALKGDCHDGAGRLHRAFSVFVFNSANELLLQKRAAGKRLWPLYWSNSCCSHPRRGESVREAGVRRMREELGLSCDIEFVYKFEYQASFGELGSENELCSVFIGYSDARPRPNATEIADLRFVPVEKLDAELATGSEQFTPWFRLEWPAIKRHLRRQHAS